MQEERRLYQEMQQQREIEHQAQLKQVQEEQERSKRAQIEAEKKLQKQVADTQQQKRVQEKLKGIRKDIVEANETAKAMEKKVYLEDIYVCKYDEEKINSDAGMVETKDEVQVKVQNFEANAVYIWS